jgi:hypothetical protein
MGISSSSRGRGDALNRGEMSDIQDMTVRELLIALTQVADEIRNVRRDQPDPGRRLAELGTFEQHLVDELRRRDGATEAIPR